MGHKATDLANLKFLVILIMIWFSGSHAVRIQVQDCCLKYSKGSLPFMRIAGYVEQKSNEACRIDAIVLYTVKGRWVCADPKHIWVNRALRYLSAKLEKMSQKNKVLQPTTASVN
ncbi:C-C motif chemokine 20-like [Chiloscyllium plagiosum]|uniref:C-C motif chemokine 20-like n=1 Tax=Chiloscyllium plagiosum TaxID=36176 RepID=UPI001CB7B79D|nr:C-C motif chemokine 20-like [Chiloscyllium plagiosum]